MRSEPLSLATLRDLAVSPYTTGVHSPLTGNPFVLVDLRPPHPPLPQHECDHLADWIARQPCPVIAIADAEREAPLQQAFDVVVDNESDAQLLIRGIEGAPIAAMTLVQVLRATAALPLAQGLLIESLAYSTLQSGPEFKRWLFARTPTPPDTDPGAAVVIEREGEELRLRLNRPDRRNAISVGMRDQLIEALQWVIADSSIARVTVSGNGACFSIGGDLSEFGSTPDPATAHVVRSQRLPAMFLAQCAERVHFHVHSACIGAGIEIPAFGQHITANRNAFFQLPEIRFGLIPGAGGCISLPRRIGRQRTAYLVLSGKKINAATALHWGLIDAVTA